MCKVTYMDRNGFIAVTDKVIMVFDLYRDPSHALHKALEHNPEKPVVFFVTNYERHEKSIYELAQNHKRVYVMSNDVLPQNVPDTVAVAGMSKGDIIEDVAGCLRVKAYDTALKGVAFLVTDNEGHTIFHAGLLDDPIELQGKHAEKNSEECKTGVAINRIASECPSIDIAFFPADTDMTSHVAKHALQFLKEVKVRYFFPIHLGTDEKTESEFAGYAVNGAEVHYLREPGQSITL